MSTDRFHKAAKDGLIEVLKEATRRDCNFRDEQGMTPTLYAAFHGHLEALRLLCGRGGDPDKADYFGNTAVHLSAAQGHKHVVTFLANFGANVFAMDIDERTAKDLAGLNNRDDILRFLDSAAAKLEISDKKKAKSLKEKAKKECEKRLKEFNKRQIKAGQQAEKLQRRQTKEARPSMINTLKMRIKSGSMSNLSQNVGVAAPRTSFSAIVGGGTVSRGVTSSTQRKVLASKSKNTLAQNDDFKISEIEDGKRSVRSIKGYRRDSEVLYGGTLDDSKRGRLDGVFNEAESALDHTINTGGLTRSVSQPDFMHELNNNEPTHQQQSYNETGSIFVRPGIGSIAFRKSITNTLQSMSFTEAAVEESSIGSAGSIVVRQKNDSRQASIYDDDLTESETSEEEEGHSNNALERFLTAWGLGEYLNKFEEQKIDLDTLMILTENDFKTLSLPLGPYRKLRNAIEERKAALDNPGEVTDGLL